MSNSSFVAGVLVGVAIGSAAGLLLAPRSGVGARQWLLATAPQALDPGTVERLRNGLAHRLAAAREAFREGREDTRKRMEREALEARRRAQNAFPPPESSPSPPGNLIR